GRALLWRSELGERFGETEIGAAIGFDKFGERFESRKRGFFVGLCLSLIPFGFERWQIEKEKADGENFPFAVFANHAHENVAGVGGVRVGGFAEIKREKGEAIAKIGAANLEFDGAVRSFATDDGPAGGVDAERRLAGIGKEHEAFHKLDAGGFGQAGEGFLIACGEKTGEGFFVVRARCGKDVAKSGGRTGRRGGGGGPRAGFLGRARRTCGERAERSEGKSEICDCAAHDHSFAAARISERRRVNFERGMTSRKPADWA